MLTLPIKKQWYDMILNGEKLEEYRDLKEYYDTRFCSVFGTDWILKLYGKKLKCIEMAEKRTEKIRFRNGYSEASPSFVAECTLRIGEGREEWGAIPGKRYFILEIQKIVERGKEDESSGT